MAEEGCVLGVVLNEVESLQAFGEQVQRMERDNMVKLRYKRKNSDTGGLEK